MLRSLLKIAISCAWVAASVFLVLSDPGGHHEVLRGLAAVLLGLPGLRSLLQGVEDLTGKPNAKVRNQVKRTLQASINHIYQQGLYPGDVAKLSFHVWLVPNWYRTFVPNWVRKRAKRDRRKLPVVLRPRLQRAAMFRWEHHVPSRITFRKGVGIIGRCIDLNEVHSAMHVRLDGDVFQRALRDGPEKWRSQDINVTQNLNYDQAKGLSSSYGQVAALVLSEASGEAIGCITLDLPPGAKVSLRRPSGKALMQVLHSTAESVETLITSRAEHDQR